MIIVIAIVVILVLWYYNTITSFAHNTSPESKNYPTIHERCHRDSTCGGDLSCDAECHRCKKLEGGDCASDVDCISGLKCQEWKCTTESAISTQVDIEPDDQKKSEKKVQWDETKNQTRFI